VYSALPSSGQQKPGATFEELVEELLEGRVAIRDVRDPPTDDRASGREVPTGTGEAIQKPRQTVGMFEAPRYLVVNLLSIGGKIKGIILQYLVDNPGSQFGALDGIIYALTCHRLRQTGSIPQQQDSFFV
jgi:hypothetical protein